MEQDIGVSASDFESLCNGLFTQSPKSLDVIETKLNDSSEGNVETKLTEPSLESRHFEVDLRQSQDNDWDKGLDAKSNLSRASSTSSASALSRTSSVSTNSVPSSLSLGRGQSVLSEALFSLTTDAHFGLAQSAGSMREETGADHVNSIEVVELSSDDAYESAFQDSGSLKNRTTNKIGSKINAKKSEQKNGTNSANTLPPPLPPPLPSPSTRKGRVKKNPSKTLDSHLLSSTSTPASSYASNKRNSTADRKNVKETRIGSQRRLRLSVANQLGQIRLNGTEGSVEQIEEDLHSNLHSNLGQRRSFAEISELKFDDLDKAIPEKMRKLSLGDRGISLLLTNIEKTASPTETSVRSSAKVDRMGAGETTKENETSKEPEDIMNHEQSIDLMEQVDYFPPSYSDDELLSILQEVGVELGQEMIYPTCTSDHEGSKEEELSSEHELESQKSGSGFEQLDNDSVDDMAQLGGVEARLEGNNNEENGDVDKDEDGLPDYSHHASSSDLPSLTSGDERISQIAEAMRCAQSISDENKPIPLSRSSQLFTQHDLAQIVADARIKEKRERMNANKTLKGWIDRVIQQLNPIEEDDCKMGANPNTSLSQIAELLTTQRMRAAMETKPFHSRPKKYGYVAKFYSPTESYEFLRSLK